jgi:hypothetical protein
MVHSPFALEALAVDGSGKAATGEARKDGAKRRGVDRSAVRTGSRSLHASTGVARIRYTTASASGVKEPLVSIASMNLRLFTFYDAELVLYEF